MPTGFRMKFSPNSPVLPDLKVISRISTAKYKSKPEDLKTVSQQLGVATILEGTVQRAGDKVRVNVQLLDARADSHLWAGATTQEAMDIFAVERGVAGSGRCVASEALTDRS